jgi:hypothetical protein
MALQTNLPPLNKGTDHRYEFAILDSDQALAIDIAGWTLSWMLKRSRDNTDAQAVITKRSDVASGILIAGTYNATPSVNTQRATVVVDDVDTDALTATVYAYELKRMDAGLEAVLAYGNLVLVQSIHRQ